MARLRIRVELSRGGVGVPLHKLASVITESQKFLNLLTEDVCIEGERGEWLGFDFDRESLNFTAEYVGAVTTDQVEAFNAAFDGTTSLRRDTIAQFLQIANAIGEEEVIGFGLYPVDETAEPTEWRCLSRRDAFRIAEEVRILMGTGQAPHLSVSDPSLGARMFGDRRDRNGGQNRLAEYVREVESGLSNRMQRVETQVQKHTTLIHDLHTRSATTETSFRNLLSTFETFCNQATRNIERMSPQKLPAGPVQTLRFAPRGILIAGASLMIAVAVIIGISLWPARSGALAGKPTEPASITQYPPSTEPATVSAASPANPAASIDAKPVVNAPSAGSANLDLAAGSAMEVGLEATEPSWISMKDQDGKNLFAQLLLPGSDRTVSLQGGGTLRTGNAGGLVVRLNGKSIGPLGPRGQIREVEFKGGNFTVVSP
jgi:RodZ C-terminal domain